jgi:hypothetical protein
MKINKSTQKEVMNEIEEIKRMLIAVSNKLVTLSEDRKLDMDTSIYFEHLSHDTFRMYNKLTEIKQSYGV